MIADFLDGECIIGIMPVDIVLDQKDRRILGYIGADACKKLLRPRAQHLVEFLVGKAAFKVVDEALPGTVHRWIMT